MSARLIHAELAGHERQRGRRDDRARSSRSIDEIQPTTIYTHTIRDVHQDHRNVHSATLVAARGISRVFCYQAPSTTVEFKPTRFVAIDEFLERKIEVIQAYASQVKIRALPRRGAAARHRPLLGALQRRRATWSRWRWCATATRPMPPRARRPPASCPRRCDRCRLTSPRVLVTGAGGPSGISILRAMDGDAGDDARGRHRPVRRRASTSSRRRGASILPRGDDPRFADACWSSCRRERVDVVVPDRRQRAAAARAAPRASSRTPACTLVLASRGDARRLPGQVGAGRALPRRRARAGDRRRRRRLRPGRVSRCR